VNPIQHLYIYAPQNERFSVTLELFAARVSDWAGLYFEMDGSFVWAIRDGDTPVGQIDGMIYDRDGAIEYLDLKGVGPVDAWERLLVVLLTDKSSWSLENLRIFDVTTGNFRSWAELS